jgi:hypothetical protein
MNLTFDQIEKRPEVDIKDVDFRVTRRRLDNSLDVEFVGRDTQFYNRVRVVLGSHRPKGDKSKSHFGQKVWNQVRHFVDAISVMETPLRNIETRFVSHNDYSVDVRFFDKTDGETEYSRVRVMLGSTQATQATQETLPSQQEKFNRPRDGRYRIHR